MVVTRMGVQQNSQGQGLGGALLRDALIRTDNVADIADIRVLLIHAKNDRARDFYLKYAEFEPSPTNPPHLMLLLKDLRLALHQANRPQP